MDKVNDRINELEGRLANLVKEKAQLKKDLKTAHLESGLFRALRDQLEILVTPFDSLPTPSPKHYNSPSKLIDETLVLHLSDAHADEIVLPHKVQYLEEFNFDVALCRAERLVDSIIDWTQHTLANHRFRKFIILMNGDMTSGCIHGGEGHSQFGNALRNSLAIGQMVGLMVRDLAPFFESVDIVCTSGNHGRRSLKKDYEGAWQNYDYLISEVASMYNRTLTNVKYHIPDSWSYTIDIEGHGFHVCHGDDIKAWNGIPWYGLERKTRRLVALHNSIGRRVSYFCFGHFHSVGSTADLKGEMIVNGAWPATDSWTFEACSGYREPMQLLHGVHAKHGVTWRLPIKIKDPESEKRGPQRYSVILAQPGMEDFEGCSVPGDQERIITPWPTK